MLDPERMAREWVPGNGAVVVRLLARGLHHATYRVRRDGSSYAMRLPLVALRPASRAIARRELRILSAAAAAGLAPAVARYDPVAGVLVTQWIRGRCWTRAQTRDPANAMRIAILVQRIHTLKPGMPRRAQRPADWIRHYNATLARYGAVPPASAAALAGDAARRIASLARLPPTPVVLCHSDLHRLNLLDSRAGLTALDWEYAHYSDPYWDLAGWLSVNDLGEAYAAVLLCGYHERAAQPAEMRRLAILAWLYDYVCLQWSYLYLRQRAEPPGTAVARRARLLEERLMQPARS